MKNFVRVSLLTAIGCGFLPAALAQALPTSAQVAAYAEQLLDEQKLGRDGPGVALLVARGDQLIYRGARGMASLELGVPLSADQVFRIGSVTKQFAAAALLKLVDEGKARLEDPLSKYLPDYPKGEHYTLAMLLNHTSGIKSYTGIPGYMVNPVRRELDTAALVAEFKDLPVDFAPGAGWRYNNSGYVLVGAVIEKITGKPWHEAVQQMLLAPQGLTRTAYPGETLVVKGMVTGYGYDAKAPDGGVVGGGLISMTQPHAAGALVSTVDDLWRWNLALHTGRLLAPATYARMIAPEGAAQPSHYGFGIIRTTMRGETLLQHGGGINGFVSSLAYLPQSRLSVVLLRNTTGPGLNMDLVSRKLGAYALGKSYPDVKPVAVPVEQLKALEGAFTSADGKDTRTLGLRDGALVSVRGGGRPVALIPVDKDLFAVTNSIARLQIDRAADGRVSGLRVFQDGEGEAEVWTRSGDLPARAAITLSAAQQQALVGEYASTELQIKVFVDDQGVLRAQVPGQPAFELKATTPVNLYLTAVDATLDFELGEGRAIQATLLQGRARIVLKRR